MKLRNLNDLELLNRYSVGEEDAISEIIDRYKKRVFDYIRNMVKSEALADDIFQETFIKIVKSLNENRYVESGKLLSWMLRIAHNQVIDYFRKTKSEAKVSYDNCEVNVLNNKNLVDSNVEDRIIEKQQHQTIRRLVERLSAEQKEVVILRHYHGLSFKEIAEKTGVSINTSLGRMRYALINLRKMIEEENLALC
ncbi:MAG: sigma-70 family RNA polymerase sigma factor [Rikenellaceae bacterium]|jgi:RNA polymerase sigma-70 factor (ECF subfamily)|nr:sigma-70 family RNA polymerase sigma factor [Rikenellaceae bacterium]MBO7213692.1 sigma-70 family RNA polymerase sigma factor [Rikenellaceae bacterium]